MFSDLLKEEEDLKTFALTYLLFYFHRLYLSLAGTFELPFLLQTPQNCIVHASRALFFICMSYLPP